MSSLTRARSSFRSARRAHDDIFLWEFPFKQSATAYYAIAFDPDNRQFSGFFVFLNTHGKPIELPTDAEETETLRSWLPPEAIAECTAAAIAAQVTA